MKRTTSFRLSEKARLLIDRLSDALGVSLTSVIEMAVREFAKKHGIKEP